jgi:hypothetical protein
MAMKGSSEDFDTPQEIQALEKEVHVLELRARRAEDRLRKFVAERDHRSLKEQPQET